MFNSIDKKREYERIWYQKNKEKRKKINNEWRKRNCSKLTDFKKTLSCSVCGESDYRCLDFHHRNQSEKESEVSTMSYYMSFEKVINEASKCDVLCANCHRKLHREL